MSVSGDSVGLRHGFGYAEAMSEDFRITVCPATMREAALRRLHEGLQPTEQEGLVRALQALENRGDKAFRGLLIAETEQAPLASCWVQFMPGSTAVMWPPAPDHSAGKSLLSAASNLLEREETVLAQILYGSESPIDETLLAEGGFHKLADLAYLTLDAQFFPQKPVDSELAFAPYGAADQSRMESLLESTYVGTLDCPVLNGVRPPSDCLAGYAAQGDSGTKHWYRVTDQGKDAGVLLVAEHSENRLCELVYMALIPEARGHGRGWSLLQHALWLAGQMGAERVVLAVDENNYPALRLYHKAGFVTWDRRRVYARIAQV